MIRAMNMISENLLPQLDSDSCCRAHIYSVASTNNRESNLISEINETSFFNLPFRSRSYQQSCWGRKGRRSEKKASSARCETRSSKMTDNINNSY